MVDYDREDEKDMYGDLEKFDKKMKVANHLGQDDSSDDDQDSGYAAKRKPLSEDEI
jgi:hypothetical protein